MDGRRLAHVISARGVLGGAERTLVAITTEAARRGWTQLVINPFADEEMRERMTHELDGVEYHPIPYRSWRSLPRIRHEVRKSLADFQPDIVHAHLFHALAIVSTLRRRGEKRVLSHQHGRLLLGRRRYAEAGIDWLAGLRYDRIITCSRDVERFVLSRYRYPSGRVLVIHNGWQGNPMLEGPKAAVPTVVCIANLRPEKGHAVLLDAWRRVVSAVPSAVLELVGGGPLEPELRHLAREIGIDSSVRFVGSVDDVWPFLARAHVFALPSLHEPFGMVAVEAMAAGLPVVASNVGGLPEFIDPGVNGVLVPAGDAESLAAELTDLLVDSTRRAALGEAARLSSRGYTMARTVDQYLAVYDDLAAAGITVPLGAASGPGRTSPREVS